MKIYEGQEVEVVDEPVSPEEFLRNFAAQGKPTLFRNMLQWPAFERWSYDYLSEKLSGALGGDDDGEHVIYFDLGNYASCLNNKERVPVYAGQQDPPPKALKQDVPTPPHVPSKQLLRERLWLGPVGSQTPLHADGYQNLVVIVRGEKKFTLLPPRHAATFSYSAANIAYGRFPEVELENLPPGVTPIEVTVRAGECFFLPLGWFHQVTNVTNNIMVQFWWRGPDHLITAYSHTLRRSPSLQSHEAYTQEQIVKGTEGEIEICGSQDDLQLMRRLIDMELPHNGLLFGRRWIQDAAGQISASREKIDTLKSIEAEIEDLVSRPGWFSDQDLANDLLARLEVCASQLDAEEKPARRHDLSEGGVEDYDLLRSRGDAPHIRASMDFSALREKVYRTAPRGSTYRAAYVTPTLLVWKFAEAKPSWELFVIDPEDAAVGTVESDEVGDMPLLWGLTMHSQFDLDDVRAWYRACELEPDMDKISAYLEEFVSQSILSRNDM